MHVLAMKYELYNVGDSAYELNVLTFTFKTGVAKYQDK